MSDWTDEVVADLKQMKAVEGLAVSKIAAMLNKKYGTAFTRGAISGKSDRLGIKAPDRIYPLKRKVRTRRAAAKKAIKAPFEEMVPTVVTDIPEPVLAGTPEPLPGKCRYPRGENPHYDFCSAPRGKGRASYCEFHHKLCNVPGMTAKEARARRQRRRAA